ncbi:TPA: DUF551 domain-containing protein [Serratia marcescens]
MTLTIEELKYGAEVGDLGIDAVRAVCAELLAIRESQPVYQYRMRNPYNGQVTDWETIKREQVDFILKETIAANVEFRITGTPPAVPEAITAANAPEVFEIAAEVERLGLRGAYGAYAVGWNSCIAAMLAQPVSGGYTLNSPEIPDGWVACSERMPEEGDVVLVLQEGGIIFCAEVDGGEFYPDEFPRVPTQGREITHWMPLPAAPEGGNG